MIALLLSRPGIGHPVLGYVVEAAAICWVVVVTGCAVLAWRKR